MELEEIVRPFERRVTGIRFTGQGAPDQYASYHELAGLGVGFANALRRVGVELGEPVGLVLANDKSSVVAMLGCWIAGSPVVSIPPAGRGIGADLYCEGFSAVLDQVPCRTVFGPGRAQGSLLPTIRFFDTESFVGRLEASTADPLVPIPDQALIQFTSGSTSLPRGVVLQKDTVVGHLDMLYDALELTGHDPAVSWLPLHHDMGLIGFFMVPLMTRGPLTLMDPLSFIRNPLRWLDECAAEHATITGAPNFGYRLATRALKRSTVRRDLRDIRLCLAGADFRNSAPRVREGRRSGWLRRPRPHAGLRARGGDIGRLLPRPA